ncbi:MAG: UbiA family prenyltransferase [Thermoplasmata archaeon]
MKGAGGPGKMSSLSWPVAYLRMSRAEYLPAEIPGLLTIYFIGASSPSRILAPEVIEAILVFVLLYFVGFIANAYTDREIDKRYTIFKNKIPEAVERVGDRNIIAIIVTQLALAFALTAHICIIMESLFPAALVAVGTFFGVGYSIPPLHFKVRGWLHAVSLTLSAFLIPGLFVLFAIAGEIAPAPLTIVVGFSILHYGIAFANQAIDYLEDRAGGVMTPPVRWGMGRSLRVALVSIFAGIIVVFAGLYWHMQTRSGSISALPGMTTPIFFALMTPVVLLGYYIPVTGLWKMYRASATRPIEEATRYMKDICRYNTWQASGIIGLMVATGAVFFAGLI